MSEENAEGGQEDRVSKRQTDWIIKTWLSIANWSIEHKVKLACAILGAAAAIVAAFISRADTPVSIVINNRNENRPKGEKRIGENKPPEIVGLSPELNHSDTGEMVFFVPTIWQLNAKDDRAFPDDPVKFYIARHQATEVHWIAVEPQFVHNNPRQNGHSLTSKLDTQGAIFDKFKDALFGAYRVRADVVDQDGQWRSKEATFSLAYQFALCPLPLDAYEGSVTPCGDVIEIRQPGLTDRFAYARIAEAFHWGIELVITGRFTICRGSGDMRSPAFDISLYDTARERIALVLGEASPKTYRIKVDGDGGKLLSGPELCMDGQREHFFEVRLTRVDAHSAQCSLAVQAGRQPDVNSWTQCRTLGMATEQMNIVRVMLKLWRSGNLKVSGLTVVPSAAENTAR